MNKEDLLEDLLLVTPFVGLIAGLPIYNKYADQNIEPYKLGEISESEQSKREMLNTAHCFYLGVYNLGVVSYLIG